MVPVIIQNTIQILKTPSSKIFFTSLIPEKYIGQLAYRLPVMVIHLEVWMSVVSCPIVIIPVFYLYAFPTAFILKEMIA